MTEATQRPSRASRIAMGCLFAAIVVPAAVGFTTKFVEFVRTLSSEEGGGFTLVPIANYVLVSLGFVCLLVWAVVHGMFRNVEKPKYTMIEREAELDRQDGHPWSE